ncbi:hypothetical protein CW704_03900 [Candidatus Bathyarchaeota archaeon]|nr:MAG: hypothetical protein CW704_03900 [Candidatus Bathyarchaeota archaeon]
MGNKRLLIIYYSGTGNTRRMAEEIGKGAERLGIDVNLMRVEDCSLNIINITELI